MRRERGTVAGRLSPGLGTSVRFGTGRIAGRERRHWVLRSAGYPRVLDLG